MRRRIVLSGEDVDTLRRVAPFAARDAMRPTLTLIHLYDGLAFATDSYRLAFGEVDCDDLLFPAKCVDWLPLDGVTLDVTAKNGRFTVSWETENGTVADSWTTDEWRKGLTLDNFLTLTGVGHREPFRAGTLSSSPCYTVNLAGPQPTAVVMSPTGETVWVDYKFLRQALGALNEPLIAFSPKYLRPLWLWDDDLTILQMPVRPMADLHLRAAEAA